MFKLHKGLFLLSVKPCRILKNLRVHRVIGVDNFRCITCSVYRLSKNDNVSLLFTPNPVTSSDETGTGFDFVGKLSKLQIAKIINTFFKKSEVRSVAMDNGLDDYILNKGFSSFRKYCLETENLPADLHITLSDISKDAGNHLDILPYFLRHVREAFPHLECMDELKSIGDLRSPANWYQQARKLNRKIYFHAGPTNSGKTYHATKRFFESKSGIYCAPLKLLAVEVFNKTNKKGIPCDLVTGEEIIHVNENGDLSNHICCTIEMAPVEKTFDVAVIDEIQMLKDRQRGWAWTRALLGLKAKEIHICGEESTLELVGSILLTTNEQMEVTKYERLTPLTVVDSINHFYNIQPGDCIVCFNKYDIYLVTKQLEDMGIDVAVIYGSLPPGTKVAQCKKFNDPQHPCKVLVSTDAIGMGLNLSINRIIFFSLHKSTTDEMGKTEKVPLSVSQALQIAGRAGRYGTQYSKGFATTFYGKDLPLLKDLLSKKPDPVLSAGLLPTLEQIELYSYYLPNSSLSNLIEIFTSLSSVDDSLYFLCDTKSFKSIAEMIEHVALPIPIKYIYCCSPVNIKSTFACTMLIKFAKLQSINNLITFEWLHKNIGWPKDVAKNTQQLAALEEIHDVLDLYMWLSNRFHEYFPDVDLVRKLQGTVDKTIAKTIDDWVNLLKTKQGDDVSVNVDKKDLKSRTLQAKRQLNLQRIFK